MDTDTLTWILGIAGFLIVSLLGIITYFLRQFVDSVQDIKSFVDSLRITVAEDKMKFSAFEKNHYHRHEEIDKELYNHSKQLEQHTIKLAKLS